MSYINRIERVQEKRLISIFQRAARHIPFYKRFLEQSNVDVPKVTNIQKFRDSVPILDKEKLFTSHLLDVSDISLDGSLKDCQLIFPSSGYSGKISFGLVGKEGLTRRAKIIDYALDLTFDITHKKTLLINSLSMGINIPSSQTTIVNTGLRGDIALSAIRIFGKKFDQIIIVGENTFIKNLLEEGAGEGISWRDYHIHVVFGGESFPESFRTYIERILGVSTNSEQGIFIGSSFGFAEIGINVLWETFQTIEIRKKACPDEKFRMELLGDRTPPCPILFEHNPLDVYIEEFEGRLVFTSLNTNTRLPIIRYATGDEGFIIPYENKVILIAVKSRGEYLDLNGRKIYPDLVKDAIYSDPEMPALTTGHFRMKKNKEQLGLEIQLKKNVSPEKKMEGKFKSALSKAMDVDLDLTLYPYSKFPYAMELDFERKFKYI